jgi:hypothetical protein
LRTRIINPIANEAARPIALNPIASVTPSGMRGLGIRMTMSPRVSSTAIRDDGGLSNALAMRSASFIKMPTFSD